MKNHEPWKSNNKSRESKKERKTKTQPNRVKSSEEPVEWHIGLMMFKCARKPLVNLNVWLKERASTLVPTEKLEEDTMGAYSNSPTHTHNNPPTHTKCAIARWCRESVSKHKAISRSEYRQTQGIVLREGDRDNRQHTNMEVKVDEQKRDWITTPQNDCAHFANTKRKSKSLDNNPRW